MPITALPTPPTREDAANFSARADSFLAALPTFAIEANALATAVNDNAAIASAAASTATTKAGEALASATLAQNWATKTSGPVSGSEYSAKYWAQQAATFNPALYAALAGALFVGAVTARGTLSLTSAVAGNPQIWSIQDQSGTAVMEFGRMDGSASSPGIDFHSGATATDYDTRIQASGGNGTIGGGTLAIDATNIHLGGTNSANAALSVTKTASQVNRLDVAGATTTNRPTLSAQGSDTHISLNVTAKGTSGTVYLNNGGGTAAAFSAAASAVNYVAIAGTATGVTPWITAAGSDANVNLNVFAKGNATLIFGNGQGTSFTTWTPASGVNYVYANGAATGGAASIGATGTDANVGLSHYSKGTGVHGFYTNGGGTAALQFAITHTASAVNYLTAWGAATGSGPGLSVNGSDTNVNFNLYAKGAGTIVANGPFSVTGNTTLGDASGDTVTFNAGGATIPNSLNFDLGNLSLSRADNSATLSVINRSSTANRWPQLWMANYNGGFTGGFPTVELNSAQGTSASPTSVASGQVLGGFNTWGHNGTAFQSATRIQGEAEAAFSTAVSAKLTFYTTLAGVQAVSMTLAGNGNATFEKALIAKGTTTLASGSANHLTFTGASTGSGPTIAAAGSDANCDVNISGKGTGVAKTGGLEIGWRDAPQNIQNGNYTLALSDRAKHVLKQTGSTITYTVPPNSSVAFPIGSVVTLVNGDGAGNLSVAQGAGVTIVLAGSTGSTGTRALAPYAVATLIKTETDKWLIAGSGVA